MKKLKLFIIKIRLWWHRNRMLTLGDVVEYHHSYSSEEEEERYSKLYNKHYYKFNECLKIQEELTKKN